MFGFSKEAKAERLARREANNKRFKEKMAAIDAKHDAAMTEIAEAKQANKDRFKRELDINNAAFRAEITAINKR